MKHRVVKVRMLELADRVCHRMFDWYITAEIFGRHLPGWGRLQLLQWHLCIAAWRAIRASEEDA